MRRRVASVQLLLDHGADYMYCGLRKETALALTAQDERKLGYQYCMPITDMLQEKAKEEEQLRELVTSHNSERATSLWQACHNNLPEVVWLLLGAGADYFASTIYDVTPLHIACWKNQRKAAEILLQHASQDPDQAKLRAFLNHIDYWGRTALNAAACNGNSEIVALLLEKYHADYSMACPAGGVPQPLFNPLHYAVSGNHDKFAEILLRYVTRDTYPTKAKAFLDATHGHDRNDTPLIDAAGRKQAATVQALLDAGADFPLAKDNGITALIAGACSGDLSTVKALLEFVAIKSDRLQVEDFLNARNYFGKTALIDSAERDHTPIVKALLETPKVDYALQDKDGLTALHWSAKRNKRDAAVTILEFASQDEVNNGKRFENFLTVRAHSNGYSALFYAAKKGYFELTKILLEKYHAEYDTYNNHGAPPLHVAVHKNHMPVAEIYLTNACVNKASDGGRFNAFLNKRDDAGKTALELAMESNNGRFMELLKKHHPWPLVVKSDL